MQYFAGEDAAYKRLLRLAYAADAGPIRRVARDLTAEAIDGCIGIALAETHFHPDDDAASMVLSVLRGVAAEKAQA